MMQSVVPISPIPDEQEQDVINTVLRSCSKLKTKKVRNLSPSRDNNKWKNKTQTEKRLYFYIFNERVPTEII